MPYMDGFQLATNIKQSHIKKDKIKTILISAED